MRSHVHSNHSVAVFMLLFFFGAIWPARSQAATVTWRGDVSADWNTPANWEGGSIPGIDDDVIIDGHLGHHPVLASEANIKSLAIGATAASTLVISNAWEDVLTITNGALHVYGNGTLVHAANSTAQVHRINIVCHGNANVHPGGAVTADIRGYAARHGIGFGGGTDNHAAGAGHGGRGGSGLNGAGGIIYGCATNPVALGSGGGRVPGGGHGGGAIRLTVHGTLTLDGIVSANGGAGIGGGSGGSIWIDADNITGTGAIAANGGLNNHSGAGGGGGGRVALHASGDHSFTGGISLSAGSGVSRLQPLLARPGTLYLTDYRDLHPVISGGMSWPVGAYTNLTELDVVISNNAVFFMTAGSSYAFRSLSILSNSTLKIHSEPVSGATVSLKAETINVAQGGHILADEFGFTRGTGVGGGNNNHSGGGGYGGQGGDGIDFAGGIVYGSATNPVLPGSGGGANGPGGGAVILTATDTLTVDGLISANGAVGRGGGSGGSIWISAGNMAGHGSLQADGANGSMSTVGGGGGGRIMIAFGISDEDLEKLAAEEEVPGLVNYTDPTPFMGTVSVTNGTGYTDGEPGTRIYLRVLEAGTYTLHVEGDPDYFGAPSPYIYGANINIAPDAWLTNRVDSPTTPIDGLRRACFGWTVTNSSGSVFDQGSTTTAVFRMTTDLIQTWYWTNEWLLTVSPADPSRGSVNAETVNGWYTNGLEVANITATASNGFAFHQWSGPGVPGGMSMQNPLTVSMDQARDLIANFSSQTAETRRWIGGAGDWFSPANWEPEGVPDLLDNVIIGSGTVTLTNWSDVTSLVISNGATLIVQNWLTSLTSHDLTVGGTITLPEAFTEGSMSNRIHIIATNLHIQSTGTLDAGGKGYTASNGLGAGNGTDNHAGGGGYGGRGGNGANAAGGLPYGSLLTPASPGSGGGTGGSGGGVVRLVVHAELSIDGTISANGNNGNGAGSGGSIWITARDISGHGHVSADGGNHGTSGAGGGGGGRIAIHYSENYVFTGAISLDAGLSYSTLQPRRSRPGTLYLTDYSDLHPVIKGGMALPVADYMDLTAMDLVVTNGGWLFLYAGSTVDVRSLTVTTNGRVTFHGDADTGEGVLLRADSMTVEEGGVVTADEYGYTSGTGVGGGSNNHAGGGGHGGQGGDGIDFAGGIVYGSATNPVLPGSGGGANSMGGGIIRLEIADMLTVDGLITADGSVSIGGGSGGALLIHASRMSGSGMLSADGGNSSGANAGGGGGGRVALILSAMSSQDPFSQEIPGLHENYVGSANGRISVSGGSGYAAGADGTFYLQVNPPPRGTMFMIK